VSAQYADGRLTVVVAPVPEAQARRIEITAATPSAIESGESGESAQPDEGGQDTTATS
jgi:hypothetical protein